MSYKVKYSTTSTMPAYVCWRCSKCGKVNISDAYISSVSDSSESLNSSVISKSRLLNDSLNIMFETNQSSTELRNCLRVNNPKCKDCGKKAIWCKDKKYMILCSILLILGFIVAYFAVSMWDNITAWLISIALIGVASIYGISSEKLYDRKIKRLPRAYTPVTGTLNEEFVSYARKLGKRVPSPEEAVKIVTEYDT